MLHDDHNLLSKELDYISSEAREYVLDSVYCTLFNKGNQLDGNTEGTDLEWFAREIYNEYQFNGHWATLTSEERDYWLRIAKACLSRLPYLMGRISSRCKVQAEAVRSLLRAEKAKQKKEKK